MSNRIVIFNGMSNNLETLTDWFIEGDYFFMEAFDIGDGELEINAFLNIEVEGVTRVIPILRLVDGVITNVIDTELLFAIPSQFRESYRKRLALLVGEEIRIKITLIKEDTACDRTEDVTRRLEAYALANLLLTGYNSQLNLQTNAALAVFSIGIGAALPTGGLSLAALPGAILPILNPVPIPLLPAGLPPIALLP
jgi:hypothetical protein